MTVTIYAPILIAAVLLIIALVLLRRALNKNAAPISIANNDQPASGALPTPPVGADDESISAMSRKPNAPIFVVAIPRDAATLEVSFALPANTPTPDGVEVLVNESERNDFPPMDNYVIEGIEPGSTVAVQVRTYHVTSGVQNYSNYSSVIMVTMPERERDRIESSVKSYIAFPPAVSGENSGDIVQDADADEAGNLDFGSARITDFRLTGDDLRRGRYGYPYNDPRNRMLKPYTEFDFGYGVGGHGFDLLDIINPHDKRPNESEQERAERVFGNFVDDDNSGVDDRFEQEAIARLGDEGGIVLDDDIHSTGSPDRDDSALITSLHTETFGATADAFTGETPTDDDDTARFDAEGGAQVQGMDYASPGNRQFGGGADFAGGGAGGDWTQKFYSEADAPADEQPGDVNDPETASDDSNADSDASADNASDTSSDSGE